jgi:hypothetical protein
VPVAPLPPQLAAGVLPPGQCSPATQVRQFGGDVLIAGAIGSVPGLQLPSGTHSDWFGPVVIMPGEQVVHA